MLDIEFSLWALVGTLGIWCIEASYFPQILRLWRRKEATDFSIFFPGLNLFGRMLAFAYTYHIGEAVLAWGFLFGCGLRGTLLCQVFYYKYVSDIAVESDGTAEPVFVEAS